ncbi:MAG: ATP-binding protein, partial [Chromatiales bacterium]|nr:ATP-binding protein [Chromatiales bacterium]
NILAAIAGHAELALLKCEEDGRERKHLEVISSSTERGRELVQKILAFSRNEEGKSHRFSMSEEVQKALDIARATIPRSVVINDSITSNLPDVMGDPRQIHQVLQNLLNNSYHAVRDTGRRGEITVSLTEERAWLHLVVADNGIGMSCETREHIFDPFYTTKKVGEGTGLGMSVVHGIVTEHGGSIEIDSIMGAGTTIHIWLPVAKSIPSASEGAAVE